MEFLWDAGGILCNSIADTEDMHARFRALLAMRWSIGREGWSGGKESLDFCIVGLRVFRIVGMGQIFIKVAVENRER